MKRDQFSLLIAAIILSSTPQAYMAGWNLVVAASIYAALALIFYGIFCAIQDKR